MQREWLMNRSPIRSITYIVFAIAALALRPAAAQERHLVQSFPVASATVTGDNAEYFVRFDGPVDHRHSVLWITRGDQVVQRLTPRLESAPDTLYASAPRLPAGDFELHWELRSITGADQGSGSVPFKCSG
jgi:methionine-rich copper-binding protein CopC